MASLLFAVTFALPSFAGVDLTWNQPAGTPGAATDLVFDCAHTDATHRAVFVFDVSEPVPDVVALEATFGLVSRGIPGVHEPFEPFWHFEMAGCNEGAIGVSDELPDGVTGVADPWGPHGTRAYASIVAVVYSATDPGWARVSIRIDPTQPVAIAAGTTTFGGSLEWFMACAATCGGCNQPVSIGLADFRLERANGEYVPLYPNGLGCVSANGGDCSVVEPTGVFEPGPSHKVPVRAAAVCEPTPVRTSTWGSLKTLYR